MTSLTIEHLGTPASHRDERVVAFAREQAAEELEGRVMWCYGSLTRGPGWARRLQKDLAHAVAGDLHTHVMEESHDVTSVGPDDVVLLLGAAAAKLAQAVRESGAHAAWLVGYASSRSAALAALDVEDCPPGDAYVWMRPGATKARPGAAWIEALMPVSDMLTAKQVESRHEVAWASMLADVACGDRRQTVGGTFHVRPSVPAR